MKNPKKNNFLIRKHVDVHQHAHAERSTCKHAEGSA